MIDRCELELSDHVKHRIFQRGPLLVHIVKHSECEEAEAIIRPVGALKQKILDSISLEEKLARAIDFRRYKSDGELAPCDVPARLASAILSRSGDWKLPMLVGVIEAPTVLPDGSLIEQEGFDPRSNLYLCSSNVRVWLPVPDLPSQSDAIAAMRILLGPFFEFPFERESDRSTYVTEVLTGLVRRQLPTAPLFAHSAPQQASGKSLLADATGLIVTGRVTPSMPFGSSDEEVRKRLTSVLIGGDQIVNIDNVTRPIQSDALAMILSQETYADRILGTNERPTLATNSLFLATGNNLVVQGDLASRTLECRIDARRERPEDRVFAITDLRAHILRERRSLVQAGLTILKAYIAAGVPPQPVARFGRFEAWSDWVRSAVVWAGLSDPCETRERILVSDPERQALHGVLASWHALFQDRPMLVREVMAKLDESLEKQAPAEQDAVASLREIFLEIAGARNNPKLIDVRRVAAWLRSYSGRVAAGLTLSRGSQTIHKVATWRVTVEAVIERTPVAAFASSIADKPITEDPAQDREEF